MTVVPKMMSAALRSRLDQFEGRLRTLGIRETLFIQQDVLRRIFKSTFAATLAWLAVQALDSPRPALASLAAILVVQLTVRASLTRAVQLTIAVTLGLISAVTIGHFLGLHWWTISVIVLAGLVVGELLRLGQLGAQVAISAMLALSIGDSYGIERAVDTAVGAVIGAIVSIALAPPTYLAEAGRSLRALAEDLGALLEDMGIGLARVPQGPTKETIDRWLERARTAAAASRAAIATVKQGEESLQFNPRRRGELSELSRMVHGRTALDHVIGQLRGISRSLLELTADTGEPAVTDALGSLAALLRESGHAVAAYGRLVERPDSGVDWDRANLARVQTAVGIPGLALKSGQANPRHARLLGSIVVDVQRMLDEVRLTDGAHSDAVTRAPIG